MQLRNFVLKEVSTTKFFCGLLSPRKGQHRIVTSADLSHAKRFDTEAILESFQMFLSQQCHREFAPQRIPLLDQRIEERHMQIAVERVAQISRERTDSSRAKFADLIGRALQHLDTKPKKRNNQAGMVTLLIELLFATIILGVLFAMAVPSIIAIRQSQMQVQAKNYLIQVSNAESMSAYCSVPTAACNSSIFNAQLPPNAQPFVMSGEQYIFVQSGSYFVMSATPTTPGISFFIDSSGILRCQPTGAGVATITAPICPY